MKNKTVFKHSFEFRLVSRILSVLLVLVMLLLSGCDNDVTSSKVPSSAVTNSTDSSNNTETDSSNNSEADSSDNSEQSNIADPLSGEFSYEESIDEIEVKIEEIIPSGNCANLSNPLVGYAETQAENLRKEILNTANTEKYYDIKGTKYYISPNGDDANSGTSPDAALKTTEGLSGMGLKYGDAVLFERGSVFRLYAPIIAVEGVIYGSYGEGEKPKIYTSPLNFADVVWSPSKKKNVWQTYYTYNDTAGMFFEHGKEIGYKKTGLRDMSKNTDYFQSDSEGVLYLYCDKGNPAKVYESIEVSVKMAMLNIPSGTNDVVVDNLCFKYGGLFAVNATWGSDNITVTNCEMGFIGGAVDGTGTVRYGNAIQLWTGNVKGRYDHNWIYQTFDTAMSWQGNGGEKFSYEDISMSNNLFEYNNGDIEFWDPNSTVKNFTMADNIMRFTALGWGTRLNDAGSRGIEGCFVGDTVNMKVDNIIVKNNIIDCPGRYIINWKINPNDLNKEILVSGTKIYVNSTYRNTDEVLRGFKHKDSDPDSIRANSATEFVTALKKFEPEAILEWH